MVSLQRDVDSRRSWVLTGLIMGVLAGIIFAMFEMLMAAIMGQGFFMPLRMIGAIVLGQRALDPAYSLAIAGLVGLVVHMILAGLYGMVFGVVAGSITFVRASRLAMILAASIFGLLLWLVNFVLIAPLTFPWFGMANPSCRSSPTPSSTAPRSACSWQLDDQCGRSARPSGRLEAGTERR